MKAILPLLAALLLVPLAVLQSADAPARRPNILHIHADDHRADGLGAFGHPVVKTPNLDTLVARGFTFTHCNTMGSMVGAVCLPSRTMIVGVDVKDIRPLRRSIGGLEDSQRNEQQCGEEREDCLHGKRILSAPRMASNSFGKNRLFGTGARLPLCAGNG